MAKKAKTPKKRNPQDLTLRNLRALKTRIEAVEVDSVGLMRAYLRQAKQLEDLETAIGTLTVSVELLAPKVK